MSFDYGVQVDAGGPEPIRISNHSITYNVSPMLETALQLPERPSLDENGRQRTHSRLKVDVDGKRIKNADGTPVWERDVPSFDHGLRVLDGAPCTEAAGVIDAAFRRMRADPDTYRAMNPSNGWGSYADALEALQTLRRECRWAPRGTIYVR